MGVGFQNIYSGKINQYNYKEVLENKLIPTARSFFGRCENWIFQQDGAMAYIAKSVKEWFLKAMYYSSTLASMITRSEPHRKYLVMDRPEIIKRECGKCCTIET